MDRNQNKKVALHQVWGVEISSRDSGAALGSLPIPGPESNTAVDKHLKVHMKAPQSVPVGGAMNIVVRVQSPAEGSLLPEPEANLFFEVRTSSSRGVQW